MSEKLIVTIGCELASGSVKHVSFRSKSSLLDFDIVLFKPLISGFLDYGTDYFQGKPSLSDTQSFQLRESCEHWRRELKEAVAAGKTILVFLPSLRRCTSTLAREPIRAPEEIRRQPVTLRNTAITTLYLPI